MTDPAALPDPPDEPEDEPEDEFDETVFRSIVDGLTVPGQPGRDRLVAGAVTELLETMTRELGESSVGGPWDPRQDIADHTQGYLDALQNEYRAELATTFGAWAGELDADAQIRMLLYLWWQCFQLWNRSLAYRSIEAVADAVDDVAAEHPWRDWSRSQQVTWRAVGAALRLMQLDGRAFAQINLSCADRLRQVARDEAIPRVTKIWDDLGRARYQLRDHPGQIRPCVSYIWEYADQTAGFYRVIENMAEALVEFERWLATAQPVDGSRRPGAARTALRPLSLSEAPRARVVESLEFLEEVKDQLKSYTLSEIEPWEQMLIGLRDLMAEDQDITPSVLIPRQAWVRYCFPFAVQDDDGELARQLLLPLAEVDPDDPRPDRGPRQPTGQDQPEIPRHRLSRRLKEELDATLTPFLIRIGEPEALARTEFFQVGSGEAGHFGGIRIDLPELIFDPDFLDSTGRRYRAWFDLNWMGNFCLCVEATEPLENIVPPRLYRALRAGTPFVYGESVMLAPTVSDRKADGQVGQRPTWDNLNMFARGMIRAVANAYYFREFQPDRKDSANYVPGNLHEIVVVQTDAPIALQSQDVARQLDSAVGGRILLRSVQRAAGTLEEWTRFPPLQRAERRARASAVVAVPEIGYAGDWFVHTGETTVFGIVAVPAWFRDVYPEAAQFACSWSPVLQLWNRRLRESIRDLHKKHDTILGAASEELRSIEQQVRHHLAAINAEDLCSTLAYRRFLDGLLDAVGTDRLEKELQAQLRAAEHLTDYFYQREEKRATRRRDILLFFIALLGVFSLADFLALLDTTKYQGRLAFVRLSYAGQWQDKLVLILFGLSLVGGAFVWLGVDRPRNWLRRKRASRKLKTERKRSAT
jgi:hypothetical protein